MKLALNWLKEYTDIKLPPQKVGEILTNIGLEVEGEEEIESIPGGLAGLVVGHVKECGRHPNADKLSLTKVDVGGEELLQIVCGAPNIAAGQKVVVATVGTVIHPLNGEPFKIKKGKIRGEVSQGMICAEDEIGLGTDHSGIIVLPEATKVGTLVRDHYELENDYVYEIGLTPNRSDGTNQIGSAKDLAAALKINYGHSGEVRMPSVADFKVDNHDLPIEVIWKRRSDGRGRFVSDEVERRLRVRQIFGVIPVEPDSQFGQESLSLVEGIVSDETFAKTGRPDCSLGLKRHGRVVPDQLGRARIA